MHKAVIENLTAPDGSQFALLAAVVTLEFVKRGDTSTMIVDAAEFYNSIRSKSDLPCEHSIRIQRVITYPFQRNDEIIGGDAGMPSY